jgi:hypothetical protein
MHAPWPFGCTATPCVLSDTVSANNSAATAGLPAQHRLYVAASAILSSLYDSGLSVKVAGLREAVVGGSRNCPRKGAVNNNNNNNASGPVVSILLHQIHILLFKSYEVLLMLYLHHVLACKSQLLLWARCCCKHAAGHRGPPSQCAGVALQK